MYKVNGLLNFPTRRKLRELDFRAPEDRLAVEEQEESIARSPAVDQWINEFFDAHAKGDDYGLKVALQGVIDANRADHAAAGVPVYAHPPLPRDFAAMLMQTQAEASLDGLLRKVDPGARAVVARQLAEDRQSLVRARSFAEEFGRKSPQVAPSQDSSLGRHDSPVESVRAEREQRPGSDRVSQCKSDSDELDKIQDAIVSMHREMKENEAALAKLPSNPAAVRENLLEDLRKAESRSTDPGIPPFPPCPTSRPAHERDIACEIVRRGMIEKWRTQERQRLKEKKERDIREAKRKLNELDDLVADASSKRARIKALRDQLAYLGIAEKRVRDRYNARDCGRGAPY